jgi:Anti-sigma-K factor rskA, C-terminal
MERRLQRDHHEDESRALASVGLRRRVLRSVRGDTKRRDAPLMAAGVLVVLLLIGAVAFDLGSIAPRVAGEPRDAHALRAVLRRSGYHGELAISGMPEPPVGEAYQVWVKRSGSSPLPTDALFSVTSTGTAEVDIPGSLHGVRQVMVTAEPLGGSESPTGPAVLSVTLTG